MKKFPLDFPGRLDKSSIEDVMSLALLLEPTLATLLFPSLARNHRTFPKESTSVSKIRKFRAKIGVLRVKKCVFDGIWRSKWQNVVSVVI